MTPTFRPAGPRTARLINDRRAYDILLEHGPLTRQELQTLTGLSRPTVGDLVYRLEEQGLIEVVGTIGEERRGPNARSYGVVATHAFAVGVEVRADVLQAVVVDMTGSEISSATIPQSRTSPPDQLVASAVDAALSDRAARGARKGLRALVVGTPGLVDPVTGDVSYAASLPTYHSNLLPGLRDRFGVEVIIENEVNLVGLAEHRLGAASGRNTFALLWLGEGVGLAVVLEGRLYRGISGGAGEVSYIQVGPGGENLQSVAGGAAVRQIAARQGVSGGPDLASLVIAGLGVPSFVDALASNIALGAAGVSAVLDPGLLVLGGAVGRSGGEVLASAVSERLRGLMPIATSVVPALVTGNPILRGAVLVALEQIRSEIFGTA